MKKSIVLTVLSLVIFFQNNLFAQVGIGSSVPTSMLHVADTVTGTSSWEGSFIDLQNVSSGINTCAALRFKVDDVVSLQKYRAGIFFKRTTANANGTLIFSNSASTGTGNVTATSDARMAITSDGLVGIGTVTPYHKLSILGSDNITDGSSGLFMDVQNNSNTTGVMSGIRFRNGTSDQTFKGGIFYRDVLGYGRGDLIFANNSYNGYGDVNYNDARLVIKNNGNIGIGTSEPQQLLHLYNPSNNLQLFMESDDGNPKIYMDGTEGAASVIYQKEGIIKANVGYDLDGDNLFFTHIHTIVMKDGKMGFGTLFPQAHIHIFETGGDAELLLESFNNRPVLKMDGASGLSEIRFQSGGTYKAALGYNHDNDNLYFYHNGNLKFSNGNVYVTNDYNYISDKTYKKQFTCYAFTYDQNNSGSDLKWDNDGYLEVLASHGDDYSNLYCNLNLPQGAVITSLACIGIAVNDEIILNSATVILNRRGITEDAPIELASVTVSDSEVIEDEITTNISYPTIDNNNYQYFLELELTMNAKFYGAYLTYTISKVSQ